ncbi:MAG: hypothetical protein WCA04_13880 [Geobacteraceae bacterium]
MATIFQHVEKKGKKLQQVPAVAHVLRMITRYATRLGNQFAGAITYFSLLAMVPILMFAFSACGFTLTVLRPDLLERVCRDVRAGLQIPRERDSTRTYTT